MTTLAEAREGLAEALREINGLNVSAYMVEKILTPHAMIDCRITYDLTMARGADEYEFTIKVFGQRNATVESQRFFDMLRDPAETSCVKNVIEASGVGDYARVRTASELQVATSGATEFFMLQFDVEVVI